MEKSKLSGGPDNTVTWIWLEHGRLKVEHYDFSKEAHTFFGNDIAWTITVQAMEKLLSTMNKDVETLILWMEQYFTSYFGIKQWLEENGVELTIDRESWA